MRRYRRGGGAGHEFGGSGEDSFVAVVVTKLTGALLFILLLTMVIMALLPKATDVLPSGTPDRPATSASVPLAVATPESLPEAIAGRPYMVALAAVGGRGPLRWTLDGPLPEGMEFDSARGILQGTPRQGTAQPLSLAIRVTDGTEIATSQARLLVYQSDQPLSTPAWWKPRISPVPWGTWLEQGVGFVVLWLVHLVSMNAIAGLERSTRQGLVAVSQGETAISLVARRFGAYRLVVRLTTILAMIGLATWLATAR